MSKISDFMIVKAPSPTAPDELIEISSKQTTAIVGNRIKSNGTLITNRESVDFTGAGVTVTDTGSEISIVIPGGGTGSGDSYTLPISTTTTLGGVKVGSNMSASAAGVLTAKTQLDGSVNITGSILPSTDNTMDLGSATKRFANIHAEEVHIGANSLYVNGKKVIEDVSSTITVTTDVDQDIALKTTGTGDINIKSESMISSISNGGLDFAVTASMSSKNIVFENHSSGGNVSFSASGMNGQMSFISAGQTSFNASQINFNSPVNFGNNSLSGLGDVTISGNLTINGTSTTVNTTTVTTKDNLIIINSGETGAGVTGGVAGIQIDRGTLADYQFLFNEPSDMFSVGMVGDLQPVATRELSPTNTGVTFFNSTSNRFETSSKLVFDGTNLTVNGSQVITSIPVASDSVSGTVKVGSGLVMLNGVLSASGGSGGGIGSFTTKTFLDSPIAPTTTGVFLIDCSDGNVVINLPVAASSVGVVIQVKKIANGGNITVNGGASTIDGSSSVTISTLWDNLMFACNGTAWYLL